MFLFYVFLLASWSIGLCISNQSQQLFDPSDASDIEAFFNKFAALRADFSSGGTNIIQSLRDMYDENIIMCWDEGLCTTSLDAAISQYQQFHSYIKHNWFTMSQEARNMQFNVNYRSISYEQHAKFSFAFPPGVLKDFIQDTLTQSCTTGFIMTFNTDYSKIIMFEQQVEQTAYFTGFINSFSRLFSQKWVRKEQAIYDVAVLNGLIDPDTSSPPENIKLFGVINKDIFVLMSDLSSIIVFLCITIYFCYKVCFYYCGKKEKLK